MPIQVREEGSIAVVTVSNPARQNALDERMFRELAALWPRLGTSNARCVVITGAGNAFCSGADLSQNLGALEDIDVLVEMALLKSRSFEKPIVAAINGACVAGGFELALACDIRICSSTALLGLPEARWGIFPAGGAATHLASEIGYARAAELLLSARLIDAQEALRYGLVARVVPDHEVLPRALEIARSVAGNSPAAVSAIKHYLAEVRRPSASLLQLERELAQAVRRTPDAKEGAAAFLGKRAPEYGIPAPPARNIPSRQKA